MGVSRRGRRTIDIEGRRFVWWVHDDPDSADMLLHVTSLSRSFVVHYHLGLPGEPFLVVKGREFPGAPDAGGCWLRFRCPRWETDEGMTPAGVRRLIEWSLSPDRPLIEVDHRGISTRDEDR